MRDMKDTERRPLPDAEADGIIEGRNAVIEALRVGTAIDKIYLAKGETDKTLGHIASKARDAGIVVVEADRRKLDGMSRTHAHQGVIALAAVREYATVESILAAAAEKGEPPLLVVCDEISDPHNLGAILRTAECAGAHGVIIPKRRFAGLTAVVAKTSAGAVSYIPVARVANIPSLLKELKSINTKPVDVSKLMGSIVVAVELDLPEKVIPELRTVQVRLSVERQSNK